MKEHKTYTNKEVISNINLLKNELDDLKAERLELSRKIAHTKKQIVYWEELDKSQFKMF